MKTSEGEPVNSKITSGENKSYWISSVQPIIFEKIQENIETDILVIGGGISGLSTAYSLLNAGRKVILVEDGYIGSGETGRSTAHISCALDDHYSGLERIFGKQKARLAAESHIAAIRWIEKTVKQENIDCNFKRVDGYLFLSEGDKRETLEEEYEATKNAGLKTEMLSQIPGILVPGEETCILFPDQAQFHVMKYLRGLADAVRAKGGIIYTETKAEEISKEGARANGYMIKANYVVVATNTPVNDIVTMHTKQHAYRTYVIAAKIPKGKLPYSLWWDTGDQNSKWASQPYHYVRLEDLSYEYDLLIAGGEDHKVGQADAENVSEERYERLYQWTKTRFPAIQNVGYRWSGQIMEPVDSLAFIGRNPGDDNIFIITGDSGNGITHGTLGGIIVTELIEGIKNPWSDLYSPSRISLRSTGEFLKEAGNMAKQYAEWISRGDIQSSMELEPGQGGIMSSGLKKFTLYRDAQNNLHACSAVCPHLGGILKWNSDEKTFDRTVYMADEQDEQKMED